jgi:ABC-type sugar transport system ATPase subunit
VILDPAPPLISFRHVSKRFPGVRALEDVSFEVAAGSCHALCGENGAGKSTLSKLLAGIVTPDTGEIRIDGTPVRFTDPRDALGAGIGMVHQELVFCENLTVAENLCLGALPRRGLFVSRPAMERRAHDLLSAIEATLDVRRLGGDLTVAEQQVLQIAAAVGSGARVIIFDEPTSSLSQVEADHLYALMGRLRARGTTCVYVSHRMPEIFRLCDTITVLRDGKHVATRAASALDEASLVQLMIGRRLDEYLLGSAGLGAPKSRRPAAAAASDSPGLGAPEQPAPPTEAESPAPSSAAAAKPGAVLLEVRKLSSPGHFHDVSFEVRAGEIVGLAGLVGAGRSAVAEAIFGLDAQARGRIEVAGRGLRGGSPAAAMRAGVGLVPEDRKRRGLVGDLSALENLTLPSLPQLSRYGWIRPDAERAVARDVAARVGLSPSDLATVTAVLSGGNQQKVVLAKWLATRCRLLLLDEPTRGVDVGAKAEIHALVRQLAAEGTGILLVSSELPELIALSTRTLVLREGRMVGELPRGADQETLMRLMAGVDATVPTRKS